MALLMILPNVVRAIEKYDGNIYWKSSYPTLIGTNSWSVFKNLIEVGKDKNDTCMKLFNLKYKCTFIHQTSDGSQGLSVWTQIPVFLSDINYAKMYSVFIFL